ncbi:type I-U CRISPR-associated protein Cas7 [Pseudonocardia sp. C8]|nr:type I-U CRISPR-associated protein Cas7 [Pseudonocardia sp. C8]
MIGLEDLLAACRSGGASCLTSVTELAPAAGSHASVAPAKFAVRNSDVGTYAYETRFDGGVAADAVVIDSKQSQNNRCEQGLVAAIVDGHDVLSRLPRVAVSYRVGDRVVELSDLELPHRVFDGHIRAATISGAPLTQDERYRRVRDAHPGDAFALLQTSPASLVFGSWDSSRATRQGRWRSVLVGEIVGFCSGRPEPEGPEPKGPELKGGARIDPLGMRIELTGPALKELADRQRSELSRGTYDKIVKSAGAAKGEQRVKASPVGLGGIPPTLEALAGVACSKIVRSHVLSFAALRQVRFGKGAEGDAACRALLAALALAALARSDGELVLRANCDLVESGPTAVVLHGRGGTQTQLSALSVEEADALLAAALTRAEQEAGVSWNGVVLAVDGDPAILAGAVEDEAGGN